MLLYGCSPQQNLREFHCCPLYNHLNFDIGSRSNYIFSMITLSGILWFFQTFTEMFSKTISQICLMLPFLCPFWPFKLVMVNLPCQHDYFLSNIWNLSKLYGNIFHIKISDNFKACIHMIFQCHIANIINFIIL